MLFLPHICMWITITDAVTYRQHFNVMVELIFTILNILFVRLICNRQLKVQYLPLKVKYIAYNANIA